MSVVLVLAQAHWHCTTCSLLLIFLSCHGRPNDGQPLALAAPGDEALLGGGRSNYYNGRSWCEVDPLGTHFAWAADAQGNGKGKGKGKGAAGAEDKGKDKGNGKGTTTMSTTTTSTTTTSTAWMTLRVALGTRDTKCRFPMLHGMHAMW